MIRRARKVLLLALLVTVSSLVAGQTTRYAGRPLDEALRQLAHQGLKIVFSSRVVRPGLVVLTEPSARSLRGILEEILAPHGLETALGPGGRLLVVPTPPSEGSLTPEAPASFPTGTVHAGFRRSEDHLALPVSGFGVKGPGGEARLSGEDSILIPAVPVGIYNLEAVVPGLAGPTVETLSVTAGGTTEVVFDVAGIPDDVLPTITLLLAEGARFRETVEVSARPEAETAGSSRDSLSPAEVMELAGAGENLFRTLQTRPGVSCANEFDSRLSVRGGAPDENLTVIDGVEVFDPYHLFGFVSAFNPETVQSFDLSTGGFDARYGDRLSSALVMESRPGTTDRFLQGSASLGSVDADLLLEGKIAGLQNGSWLLAGRRSFYDVVAGSLVDFRLPTFGDLQTRISFELRPGRRLSFFGILSRENVDYREREDYPEDYRFSTGSRSALASLSFESSLGSRTSLRSVASFYRFLDGLDIRGTVDTVARGSAGEWARDGSLASVVFGRKVVAEDVAFRQELGVWLAERHQMETGIELHRMETRWGWQVEGDRMDGQPTRLLPFPYGVPGSGLPASLDSSRRFTRFGGWIQDRFEVSSRVTPRVGFRIDHSGINGETTWSPRASVSVRFSDRARLRAATGVYHQSPGYEKLYLSDYFVLLDADGRVDLESERSFHTLVAVEREVLPGLTAEIEAYYKSFSNLVVGRLESDEERRTRIARYDFGALESQVPSERQITVRPVNEGRGSAYGFDLLLKKGASWGDPHLTGWVSYSYGVAQREAYGHVYPFDYDRRHSLSVVGRYEVKPSLVLSGTARLTSGSPWTPPLGVRVAGREDREDVDGDGSFDEVIPARDSLGQLIYTLDFGGPANLNSARLPLFARFDARVTYRPGGPDGRWSLYVDVINILGRENAGVMRCLVGFLPVASRPSILWERYFSVPFLPSFGVRYSF